MQINVYLLIAGFLIFCNNCDPTAAIYGTNVRFANPGEFPFVVSIKRFNPDNPQPETDVVCTGVLVSQKDVLTTETCMEEFTHDTPEVIVGSNNIREGTKHYVLWSLPFTQWCHSQNVYSPFETNDITMLRLNRTVDASIRLVELSNVQDSVVTRLTGVVAAFGREIRDHISNLMETVSLLILSRRACETRIRRKRLRYPITDNLICVIGNPVALLNQRNRGAPIMYNGRLIGIFKQLFPETGDPHDPEKLNIFIYTPYFNQYIYHVMSQSYLE